MSFPNPNIPSGRAADGEIGYPTGQLSYLDPSRIPPGFNCRGLNILHRGNIAQCRPGYKCLMALPEGNLQGGEFFIPKRGNPILLFAVEGLIYVSEAPFVTFRQVQGVQFLASARQIFFQQVTQSVELNADGSISFIDSRELMVMQDGAFTLAAIYDGTRAEHTAAIPMGGPLEWTGDRLWVAREEKLFASDLANPISFTESLYLITPPYFQLPGPITALNKTPGLAVEQLLIFTDTTTSLIQSSIRDRALWQVTPQFQRPLFPTIGCTANLSVVAMGGLLWWWSRHGIMNFDSASQAFVTSKLPFVDLPMMDSKARLSEDCASICGIAVENYLLMSTPYCDNKNRHTWVFDNSLENPSWSVWTGTRPMTWLQTSVNGFPQVFHLSVDRCGCNTLWLSFTPDRLDNGCEITWFVETRGYAGANPLDSKQIRFADIWMSELLGDVDIAVFWAGSKRGRYKRVLTKRIHATRGPLRYNDRYKLRDILYSYKKQSRKLRTQDAREIYQDEKLTSCGVEREADGAEFIDENFQLLIVGSGPGAVDAVKLFTDPESGDKLSGFCEEDETNIRATRFDGAAEHGDDYKTVMAELAQETLPFRSNRTATITVDGFTEHGIGTAQGIISQMEVDKVADSIANRLAAKRLEAVLPSIVSRGGSIL